MIPIHKHENESGKDERNIVPLLPSSTPMSSTIVTTWSFERNKRVIYSFKKPDWVGEFVPYVRDDQGNLVGWCNVKEPIAHAWFRYIETYAETGKIRHQRVDPYGARLRFLLKDRLVMFESESDYIHEELPNDSGIVICATMPMSEFFVMEGCLSEKNAQNTKKLRRAIKRYILKH